MCCPFLCGACAVDVAQAIGKIAAIEIPAGQWLELVQILDANITKQSDNPHLRQSSLEALGYVCEECGEKLEQFSSLILGAIQSGMAPSETNDTIRLAATSCLVNSIQFIGPNMARPADRETIMNMVLSVTKAKSTEVRVAAFQCLVLIAENYYDYIGPFMGNIFGLTTAAIKSEEDEVAMQAVELWSSLCDVEMQIQEDEYVEPDAPKPPQPPASRLQNIIVNAVPHLTPFLLEALTRQDDNPDDEVWNTCLAAGTCLGLCAIVSRDVIVGYVLPFVQANVENPNWRFREAAILSFGCILEGPNRDELTKVVKTAFELILSHMKDPHPLAKDTTAWTIGRICSLLPEVVTPEVLPKLMATLCEGLKEPPKVASNVCWAIHNLASAVEADDEGRTSPLSAYFHPLMAALLQASVRADVKQANLQISIYEAINVLVGSAAEDCHIMIGQLLPSIMQQLHATLSMRSENVGDRDSLSEVQALLCGTLQAIVTKLESSVILGNADNLMKLFLSVLDAKNTTVHEEALMAIGAVADKILGDFEKYAALVKPAVIAGLSNAAESYVCDVAVHVMSDICRALGPKVALWGDEVMAILLRHLTNGSIERTVKSHIIACIGDIALAVGGWFDRYMQYVIPMLKQASGITFPADADYEDLDYMQKLRESIIQAYSGILLGLKSENKVQLFFSQPGLLESILALFELIAADNGDNTEPVIRGAAGLTFDLVMAGGAMCKQQLQRPAVLHIIKRAIHEDNQNETIRNGKDAQRVSTHAAHAQHASLSLPPLCVLVMTNLFC